MSWETVPICAVCWNKEHPDSRIKDDDPQLHDKLGPGSEEDCHRCGRETRSGIYVRAEVP